MFDALLFRPIFNLLAGIYAIIPGHDFGVAIIIFTVVVRFAMWPMVRKQLHNTKVMRKLQPEMKEIKKKYKGDRQGESLAVMELYKRNGVSPFTTFGLLLIQLPIFIALFSALRGIINDPTELTTRTYSFIQNLPFMRDLASGAESFNPSFLGFVDVTNYAWNEGTIVWAGMIIALLAGAFQFLVAKQLQPDDDGEERKTMRQVIKEAQEKGEEPDMSEVQANTARRMALFMPGLIVIISAVSPVGLAIYFASSGAAGYLQQRYVLSKDVEEMEEMNVKTTVRTTSSSTKKKASDRKK